MKSLVFSLYAPSSFLRAFHDADQFDFGQLVIHEFPDQESYVRFDTPVANKSVILIAALDRPNAKFLPFMFALKAIKDLGAKHIGLVLPYLPYMRQDKQFLPGEAITSKYFAALLSEHADWLITMDPHLHRYHSLDEIYTIPTRVLHATTPIANWIQQHVSSPFIIGPDSESEQWVAAIAKEINVPYQCLEKIRINDSHVQIKFPELNNHHACTPVLIDDIISTGTTMIETIKHLQSIKMNAPICIGVHAVFVQHAYEHILAAGAKSVVTCNTIEHNSNSIDVSTLIRECVTEIKF